MSRHRREALKIIGAIGVNCAFPFSADELYAQHAHGHLVQQIQPAAAPYKPQHFDAHQYAVVSRIADLIVPNTDTPGAVAAGVPEYIDRVVHAAAGQQKLFAAGLAWLDQQAGKPFLELTEEQQIALLSPLCDAADAGRMKHAGDRFFKAIKSMTADGYYTSQAGLMRDLGYNGNTVLPAYPECTHPEHKA
jgi:gluconate 2-dehydrogenase gamma chain